MSSKHEVLSLLAIKNRVECQYESENKWFKKICSYKNKFSILFMGLIEKKITGCESKSKIELLLSM